jgi:hypothetical protein
MRCRAKYQHLMSTQRHFFQNPVALVEHLNKVELACRIARRNSSIVYSDINGCCRSVKNETAFYQANHSSDSFLDEAAQSKCNLAECLRIYVLTGAL